MSNKDGVGIGFENIERLDVCPINRTITFKFNGFDGVHSFENIKHRLAIKFADYHKRKNSMEKLRRILNNKEEK